MFAIAAHLMIGIIHFLMSRPKLISTKDGDEITYAEFFAGGSKSIIDRI
jgi:hypothetical protein